MSQVHPLARTTPRVRAEIRNSNAGVTALADLYNISVATARKWKGRGVDPEILLVDEVLATNPWFPSTWK